VGLVRVRPAEGVLIPPGPGDAGGPGSDQQAGAFPVGARRPSRLASLPQPASRLQLLSQQGTGSAADPDQASLPRPPLALLRQGVRFHARSMPRAQGADPDAASVFGLANPARDCRTGWPLSWTWPPVAVAAEGAWGGGLVRTVRLKSLGKLADGQSCPYCRPCSRPGKGWISGPQAGGRDRASRRRPA
jgi:hypothetical protein